MEIFKVRFPKETLQQLRELYIQKLKFRDQRVEGLQEQSKTKTLLRDSILSEPHPLDKILREGAKSSFYNSVKIKESKEKFEGVSLHPEVVSEQENALLHARNPFGIRNDLINE